METPHLLFSLPDFAPYVELPEMDAGRLEPHMLRAQRRLRQLLGESLYAELVRLHKAESLTGDWLELHSQLLPALVYASAAHYWPFSQTTLTRQGLRQKEVAQSTAIDARTLAAQAAIYDSEAVSYEADLRVWLISHAASFASFYPAGTCASAPPMRTATVVVQAIGPPQGYDPYSYR